MLGFCWSFRCRGSGHPRPHVQVLLLDISRFSMAGFSTVDHTSTLRWASTSLRAEVWKLQCVRRELNPSPPMHALAEMGLKARELCIWSSTALEKVSERLTHLAIPILSVCLTFPMVLGARNSSKVRRHSAETLHIV